MNEILIQNGNTLFQPAVEDKISIESQRKGSPAKMSFKIVNDGRIQISEGNQVRFKVDGVGVFYGFIFKKQHDKGDLITITAYDQLRYFKNKDTYVYNNMKASGLVKMLAADFRLQVGSLEDTGWVIPSRVEDNKTLFDMVQTALDMTVQYSGKMFVLYDDFGKLMLKNIENMKLNLLIDQDTAENFDYGSTIDGESYNRIKLAFDNKETGKREIYIAQDSGNINSWGLLQHFEKIDEKINGQAKADALLKLYNKTRKNLKIKNAFGDVRVRAGCSVPVNLQLPDQKVQNFMIAEKVKHTFTKDDHFMDLDLMGGGFDA